MSLTAAYLPRRPVRVPLVALVLLGILGGLLIPLVGLTVPLLVVLGCVAIWITIAAPGVLFGLYLTIPFYKGAAGAYSPIDITFGLAVLISLQIVPLVVRRRAYHISRTGMVLWAGLALLVVGGILYAPDQTLAIGHAGTFLMLVFVPLGVGALRVGSDQRYVRQLLWTFFAIGVLTTLVGLPGITSSDRLVVLGANTINVALAALLVPLLGLTFVAHDKRTRVRIGLLILSIPALLVALATGSRGPVLVLVGVGFLGVISYFAHPRSVDWLRTAGVVAAVSASVLVVSVASSYLPAYATGRFAVLGDFISGALSGDTADLSSTDTSTTARVTLYGAATTMFEERPVLGFGTSGFEAKSNQFVGYVEPYPHDALLQFAAEYGLVGASLFVCLILAGLLRRLPDIGQPVRILFLYFLLEAMFSGDIFADRSTWGLLLLVFLIEAPALIRQVRDASETRFGSVSLANDGLMA